MGSHNDSGWTSERAVGRNDKASTAHRISTTTNLHPNLAYLEYDDMR